MSFFQKNRLLCNIVDISAILIDVAIGFLTNYFSQEDFVLFSPQNIIYAIVFVLLIILLIVCNILGKKGPSKHKSKQFQKAFRESGCYDDLMDEVKKSIHNRDYKSIKQLKKIAEFVEK